MSVDDSLQGMLERLGRAVSRAMADSEAAAEVVDRVRREGLSIYLVLESTENEDGSRGIQLVPSRGSTAGSPAAEVQAHRLERPRKRQRSRAPGRASYRLNQEDVDLLKSMGIDPSRTGRSKR